MAPRAASHGRDENQEKQRDGFVNYRVGETGAFGGMLEVDKGGNMKLYGLKNCDTCRKALKSLEGVTLVDVRADGVSDAVLRQALTEFGEALVNKRSTTWRNLSEEERKIEAFDLLKAHPSLMKRPLIERDGALFLGWTRETQQGLGVG